VAVSLFLRRLRRYPFPTRRKYRNRAWGSDPVWGWGQAWESVSVPVPELVPVPVRVKVRVQG